MEMNGDISGRYRGCLLGLAVGDALGTPLEFKPPGSFTPVTDMIGGGPFNLKPGQWTDDTSMALCLAESLIECRGFNPKDQMERYVRWWKEGHLSSTGTCFDIGKTFTKRADIEHFARLVDNRAIGENDYNLAVSSYVAQRDTREVIDITKLNAEIADIVARQNELRTSIDEIVADLEGGRQ